LLFDYQEVVLNSHLAFVDDLFLFVEATLDQVDVLSKVLDSFYSSSGQKVNVEIKKSESTSLVMFIEILEMKLCTSLAIKEQRTLEDICGVPLHHDGVSKQSYQFLLYKVTQRLNKWKVSQLSITGRVTLTKAVIQALPNHVM